MKVLANDWTPAVCLSSSSQLLLSSSFTGFSAGRFIHEIMESTLPFQSLPLFFSYPETSRQFLHRRCLNRLNPEPVVNIYDWLFVDWLRKDIVVVLAIVVVLVVCQRTLWIVGIWAPRRRGEMRRAIINVPPFVKIVGNSSWRHLWWGNLGVSRPS